MRKTASIVAAVAIASGAAMAQSQEQQQQTEHEQDQPTETFDQSVESEQDRQHRTGAETQTQIEQETQRDARDPYQTEAEQRPTPMEQQYDPESETRTTEQDESYGKQVGEQQPPTGMAPASTTELVGQTIVTVNGDEIGTVEQVGYSRQHDERVALVDVGGFLGAGDKVIAIPISELGLGGENDQVTTTMDRAAVEQAPEFDPSELVTGE